MTQVGVAVCPECKQALKVPAHWVDQAVRCKHCGTGFKIKARGQAGAQPILGWKSSVAGLMALGTAAFLAAFCWPQPSQSTAKSPRKEDARSAPVTRPATRIVEAARPEPKTQTDKPLPAAEPKAVAKTAPVKKPLEKLFHPAGRLNELELARYIDQAIQHRLDEEGVPASPLADDAEFLRRVYLDITGVLPPADKVALFLDSKEPNKRARVIDELLASPLYGQHLADVWQANLLPRTSDNRRLPAAPLERWFRDNFNSNKPWNKMVYEFMTASGTQEENGAVTFWVANAGPDKVTDKVTQMFLGIRLQCAQCHNHPFTSYKQTEYWGMAAFFSKVAMTGNPKNAAKKGVALSLSEDTRGGGRAKKKGKGFKLPVGAKIVPPKFFQGEEPKLDRNAPYRPVLAKWMASPKNPFVARAMANRTWGHLFGRGFTNPVDDMHDQNPVSHPELLGVLAEQFAGHDFDLKYLVRAVCNSKTYQRTSKPVAGNTDDDALFSHMAIKVLSPEQLFDSLQEIVGGPAQDAARGRKKLQANKNLAKVKKKGKGQFNQRVAFVTFFNLEEGADPTEYQAGIPQALRLMNSPQLNNGNALLGRVLAGPGASPAKVVEQLYLATLSRRPRPEESQKLTAYVRQQENARKGYQDVLWALLNSSEFTLNH